MKASKIFMLFFIFLLVFSFVVAADEENPLTLDELKDLEPDEMAERIEKITNSDDLNVVSDYFKDKDLETKDEKSFNSFLKKRAEFNDYLANRAYTDDKGTYTYRYNDFKDYNTKKSEGKVAPVSFPEVKITKGMKYKEGWSALQKKTSMVLDVDGHNLNLINVPSNVKTVDHDNKKWNLEFPSVGDRADTRKISLGKNAELSKTIDYEGGVPKESFFVTKGSVEDSYEEAVIDVGEKKGKVIVAEDGSLSVEGEADVSIDEKKCSVKGSVAIKDKSLKVLDKTDISVSKDKYSFDSDGASVKLLSGNNLNVVFDKKCKLTQEKDGLRQGTFSSEGKKSVLTFNEEGYDAKTSEGSKLNIELFTKGDASAIGHVAISGKGGHVEVDGKTTSIKNGKGSLGVRGDKLSTYVRFSGNIDAKSEGEYGTLAELSFDGGTSLSVRHRGRDLDISSIAKKSPTAKDKKIIIFADNFDKKVDEVLAAVELKEDTEKAVESTIVVAKDLAKAVIDGAGKILEGLTSMLSSENTQVAKDGDKTKVKVKEAKEEKKVVAELKEENKEGEKSTVKVTAEKKETKSGQEEKETRVVERSSDGNAPDVEVSWEKLYEAMTGQKPPTIKGILEKYEDGSRYKEEPPQVAEGEEKPAVNILPEESIDDLVSGVMKDLDRTIRDEQERLAYEVFLEEQKEKKNTELQRLAEEAKEKEAQRLAQEAAKKEDDINRGLSPEVVEKIKSRGFEPVYIRKGEGEEGDWTGDTAVVFNPENGDIIFEKGTYNWDDKEKRWINKLTKKEIEIEDTDFELKGTVYDSGLGKVPKAVEVFLASKNIHPLKDEDGETRNYAYFPKDINGNLIVDAKTLGRDLVYVQFNKDGSVNKYVKSYPGAPLPNSWISPDYDEKDAGKNFYVSQEKNQGYNFLYRPSSQLSSEQQGEAGKALIAVHTRANIVPWIEIAKNSDFNANVPQVAKEKGDELNVEDDFLMNVPIVGKPTYILASLGEAGYDAVTGDFNWDKTKTKVSVAATKFVASPGITVAKNPRNGATLGIPLGGASGLARGVVMNIYNLGRYLDWYDGIKVPFTDSYLVGGTDFADEAWYKVRYSDFNPSYQSPILAAGTSKEDQLLIQYRR